MVMCRLLGYATAGLNRSLEDVLGGQAVKDFRAMSAVHNDGWGTASLRTPEEPPYRRDGGAPSPETGTRLYKTTTSALHDPVFEDLAQQPARGALWHFRLASSHLPLILENQQPFFANGLSFIHNGDISDDQGRNIIENRDFPVDHSVFLSTGGRSDSAVFFAVILEYIGFGFPLDEAVAQAVRELRQSYPKSSYNCMIQSGDQLVALRASGRTEVPPRIMEVYSGYGWQQHAIDYRVIRYRRILDADGTAEGVVVASSGFPQSEADGWTELDNDQMLVASNRTGEFRIETI